MTVRIPGPIPITIHVSFWLVCALIGFLSSHTLIGTAVWIFIILLSVLFHELGHALTALFFKQHPQIELVALGGLTYHNGQKLSVWKQFLIVFNGPLFGFLLFAIATALLSVPSITQTAAGAVLVLIQVVNLFWTIINLLPVLPLDGGQLLRILLEHLWGLKGFKYALIIGIAFGAAASLIAFFLQQFFIGSLFFLFAFQNYDTMRRARNFSESDRDDNLRQLIARIEEHLQNAETQRAEDLCEEMRKKAKGGFLFALATQYLAFLKYEKGLSLESYHLLVSIKKELSDDALCLLHKAAFDQHDFPLVIELESSCFQALPTAEIALRNALAHAELKESIPAIGWLRTAIQEGLANVSEIIKTHSFDCIRQDPLFTEFISSLQKE